MVNKIKCLPRKYQPSLLNQNDKWKDGNVKIGGLTAGERRHMKADTTLSDRDQEVITHS